MPLDDIPNLPEAPRLSEVTDPTEPEKTIGPFIEELRRQWVVPIQATGVKHDVLGYLELAERKWTLAFISPPRDQARLYAEFEDLIRQAALLSQRQLRHEEDWVPEVKTIAPPYLGPGGQILDIVKWLTTNPNEAAYAYHWLRDAYERISRDYERLCSENADLKRRLHMDEDDEVAPTAPAVDHRHRGEITYTLADPLTSLRSALKQAEAAYQEARSTRDLAALEAAADSSTAPALQRAEQSLRNRQQGLAQAQRNLAAGALAAAETAARPGGPPKGAITRAVGSATAPDWLAGALPPLPPPAPIPVSTSARPQPEQLGPPAPQEVVLDADYDSFFRGLLAGLGAY